MAIASRRRMASSTRYGVSTSLARSITVSWTEPGDSRATSRTEGSVVRDRRAFVGLGPRALESAIRQQEVPDEGPHRFIRRRNSIGEIKTNDHIPGDVLVERGGHAAAGERLVPVRLHGFCHIALHEHDRMTARWDI